MAIVKPAHRAILGEFVLGSDRLDNPGSAKPPKAGEYARTLRPEGTVLSARSFPKDPISIPQIPITYVGSDNFDGDYNTPLDDHETPKGLSWFQNPYSTHDPPLCIMTGNNKVRNSENGPTAFYLANPVPVFPHVQIIATIQVTDYFQLFSLVAHSNALTGTSYSDIEGGIWNDPSSDDVYHAFLYDGGFPHIDSGQPFVVENLQTGYTTVKPGDKVQISLRVANDGTFLEIDGQTLLAINFPAAVGNGNIGFNMRSGLAYRYLYMSHYSYYYLSP